MKEDVGGLNSLKVLPGGALAQDTYTEAERNNTYQNQN